MALAAVLAVVVLAVLAVVGAVVVAMVALVHLAAVAAEPVVPLLVNLGPVSIAIRRATVQLVELAHRAVEEVTAITAARTMQEQEP